MIHPKDFYQQAIAKNTAELKITKRKIAQSSVLRVIIFLVTAFGVYLSFGDVRTVGIIILGFISVFVYVLYRHNNLVGERKLLLAVIRQNEVELEVIEGNYAGITDGEEYKNALHAFSLDIDLFGKRSFFQYLNRTVLKEGTDLLAQFLLSNSISDITSKQEAIQELSTKPEWRQRFAAEASLVKVEVSTLEILRWLKAYKSFIPAVMGVISAVFSAISFILLTVFFLGLISGYLVGAWFALGLLISGRYLKKVNKLSADTSGIQSTFQQFQKLLDLIEQTEFESILVKKKRENIIRNDGKASQILKMFARHLDALDQRNNMIFGVLGNGFLLWDIQQSTKIEKWITAYSRNVAGWFETILFFDAFNSLGNFAFNHPHYVFPEISDNETIVDVVRAGHPLLQEAAMVRNNFKINREEFFIVTGANMAGKSTFLRTVSLLIVMGNSGLPLCAEKARYSPIKLITSMRTTDSLSDDESYFFSELKRLKFIIDKIEIDNYFIILDEILKGTNSVDKAAGSQKFVEKLVRSHSTGIIATHDLSLCTIAEKHPEVKNYFFDARIIDDELIFDYKIYPGVCRNMNASFLLKKMRIVD